MPLPRAAQTSSITIQGFSKTYEIKINLDETVEHAKQLLMGWMQNVLPVENQRWYYYPPPCCLTGGWMCNKRKLSSYGIQAGSTINLARWYNGIEQDGKC